MCFYTFWCINIIGGMAASLHNLSSLLRVYYGQKCRGTKHSPRGRLVSGTTLLGNFTFFEHFRKSKDPVGNADVVVETFHIASKSFGKRLTVELHYRLVQEMQYRQGMQPAKREYSYGSFVKLITHFRQSYFVQKIAFRLADKTCSARR